MKKILFSRLFIIAGLFLFGCKAEMMNYEGKAGVYFAVQHPWVSGSGNENSWEYSPKTEVPFITTTSSDSLVSLKVKLLGNLANKDRIFKIAVVDSATTAIAGTDYDLPEMSYVIKANKAFADVLIKVYRTPSLKDTMRKVMFTLLPTEDFELPFNTWYPMPGQHGYSPRPGAPIEDISAIQHTIIISDVITDQPAGWWPGFFGTFSRAKYQLLADWYDLTWDDFSRKNMDPNRAKALAQRAHYRLKQLEAEGNPVLEADGTPMEMGPMI